MENLLDVTDSNVKIVTIMNYPQDPKLLRMCYVFLDSIIRHGAKSITILYEDQEPFIAPEHHQAIDIEVVRGRSQDVGHPHFNLRFKLPNLASLNYPFLYLDADMVVLDDLNYLWSRRKAKPWIGIDHQVVPSDARTHRSPFLNSGLQLVSDPDFYDLAAILETQNKVVPLSKHAEIPKLQMFPCPGNDQAILFRYFTTIGYDYRHPEIGPEWNSCAGITDLWFENDRWKGKTRDLEMNYPVYLIHYWSQFKPWAIHCPIFHSYSWVDEKFGW
jgi:lipopolysaccharide biosynthesis glycosyltransferase